jgi:hypothetical protein
MSRRSLKGRGLRVGYVLGLTWSVVAPAAAQIDTGPSQQTTGFWAPYSNPVNSVVAIRVPAATGGNFTGTGTIIDHRPDPDPNFGWLCVLTANHVVDAMDPTIVGLGGFGGPARVHVASNFNSPLESYGGANNIVKLGQRPVAQGGLGGVDIAVVGVRIPVNTPAWTLLSNVTMAAAPTPQPQNPRTQFTEIGFGGSGRFVNGGIQGTGLDGEKRFQNNQIERTAQINDGYYNYQSVQWDMNHAAAPANPTPFLVGEGISYGGDSGGPYLTTSTLFTTVGAFQRDGPNDPTNWPGGVMPFFSNTLIAVHTYGNSSANGFSPYDTTFGGGVPLSQAYINWIGQQCAMIPAPSGLGVLFIGGLIAIRRRRA